MLSYIFEDYALEIQLKQSSSLFRLKHLNKLIFRKSLTYSILPPQLRSSFKNIKQLFNFFEEEDNFLIDEKKGILTVLVKGDKPQIKEIQICLDEVNEERPQIKAIEKMEEKVQQTRKPSKMKEDIKELKDDIRRIKNVIGFLMPSEEEGNEKFQMEKMIIRLMQPLFSEVQLKNKNEIELYDDRIKQIERKLEENRKELESIRNMGAKSDEKVKADEKVVEGKAEVKGQKKFFKKYAKKTDQKKEEKKQEKKVEKKYKIDERINQSRNQKNNEKKIDFNEMNEERIMREMQIFRAEMEEWKTFFAEQKEKLQGMESQYNNGSRQYFGQEMDGKKHGLGIQFLTNGTYNEGEFKDDKINGKVICYLKNGDRYEGQAVDSCSNGKGIYYKRNGDWEQGEWINNERYGKFMYHFSDGRQQKRIYEFDRLVRKE